MQADWYLVATPFFSILIVLSLMALKLALKSQIDLTNSEIKKLKQKQVEKEQKQESQITPKPMYIKTLAHLLRNHSVAQPCLQNRSKNKIPLLLSFSAISILCFLNPNIIVNSVIGFPITVLFITIQILTQPDNNTSIMDGQAQDFTTIRQQVKDQKETVSKIKWGYIGYSVITSGISLVMIALIWKNYKNIFLGQLLKNILVSCAADLIVMKPVGFLLIGLPFSFSAKFSSFLENQKLKDLYKQLIEDDKNALKNCATNLSPRKKQSNSPTKIPKAIIPRLTRENSENEALKSAMQIAKRIKKQKNVQSDLIKTLTRTNEVDNNLAQQYSINHLFQQVQAREKNNKGRETPIAMFGDQDQNNTNGQKTRRKQTDLVIVQFKKDQEKSEVQPHDQDIIQRRAGSFLHSNLDFDSDVNRKQDENSENKHENRLNIVKLLNDCNEEDESQYKQKMRRHQNSFTLTLQRNDPLKINNHNEQGIQEDQMQQIDENSPERRRKYHEEGYENSQYKLKKKTKHFAGNAKRRVIKFTSGQPYLQYLPNMLAKDQSKHKKSQPINCKHQFETIVQERRKSVKKVKGKKQAKFGFVGDENFVPGALQVEDL